MYGGSIKLVPSNYDISNNEENGLMAGKFPTLNWSGDEYINWLTQNSVNIGLGVASNTLEIVKGLATSEMGVGIGNIAGGTSGIINQMASIYQHSLQPNSARGSVNGGDINVCSEKNGFFFYHCSIKKEYAEIIDKIFTKYGYKVNSLKVPNITGRTYWNYVEINKGDVIGFGEIPSTALEQINEIFYKGVTIWHNHANIGNYNLSNTIVS